jgi:pyruvate carboxylase subunit B
LAREGEAVDAGRGLVVLEAMKMENELRAAAPGVVASIRVTPGQAVEKGQVLIEFVSVAGGAPPLT